MVRFGFALAAARRNRWRGLDNTAIYNLVGRKDFCSRSANNGFPD
jgi:hypothetical protein